MTITQDSRPIHYPVRTDLAGTKGPARSRLKAALAALAAGWSAAADFRRLESMTDQQLRTRRLSQAELSQEVFRRRFAGLSNHLLD